MRRNTHWWMLKPPGKVVLQIIVTMQQSFNVVIIQQHFLSIVAINFHPING
jgi:hypothetical protein